MQLPWDEHFIEIVIPAWQAFLAADRRLSEATNARDQDWIKRAGYDALREAGAAAFYVHHFAEVVLRSKPIWLPAEIERPREVWDWLAPKCLMLRTERRCADVSLLGDVADALKHAVLTQRLDLRQVTANEEVLVVSTGWGELGWGEGKWGRVPQVVVLAKAGKRALSTILQNVIDAWRRAAGMKLPDIGAP
jgi:hypothetical protein